MNDAHTPKLLSEADAVADLAGVARPVSLIERLTDEADLCAHEGAEDIAVLLYESAIEMRRLAAEREAWKWGYEYLQDRMESIERHGWAHDCDGEIQCRIAAAKDTK